MKYELQFEFLLLRQLLVVNYTVEVKADFLLF